MSFLQSSNYLQNSTIYRLAKIISHILRDLYAIRPPSSRVRVKLSAQYSEDLLNWRRGLSRFLDADGIDPSLLIPLFQRQRSVLNLAYYHALILIHRPFLLSNFASLNSRNARFRGAPGTPDMDKNVGECLDAAMHIAAIVNELTEGQQIYRAFWVSFGLGSTTKLFADITSLLITLHFVRLSYFMFTQYNNVMLPERNISPI